MKHRNMSRRPADRFDLRVRDYLQNSIATNTRDIVQNARAEPAEYDREIKKHLFTFQSTNQEIIGSHLFTLLYQARHDREVYFKNRISILRDIYKFVHENRAWMDLWRTFANMEKQLYECQTVISHQLLTEVFDMFRLHVKHPQWISGLSKANEPIWRVPPFYITKPALDYIQYPDSQGRKKTRVVKPIQYQTMEFAHYLCASFGLYNEDNLDLIAQNGIDYDQLSEIKLPRQISEMDPLCDFIINNQRFTMNPNGVVVDCYNAGSIDRITMVDTAGYLVWKVHFTTPGWMLDINGLLVNDPRGSEYCGTFERSTGSFLPRSQFTVHSDYIEFEYDIYTFVLECYADIVCGTLEVNKKFKRQAKNVGMELVIDEASPVVDEKSLGFRYTPRTVHNEARKNSCNKQEFEDHLKRYFISGHIRRLPNGFNASHEALQSALEFGIDLPDGYTFVRPYESGEEKIRTHYIKRVD